MTQAQAEAWRDALSKLGTLWCVLLAVTLLDAVISKFREPPQVFHVLAGETIQVTGPVGDQTAKIDDLIISGNPPTVAINVDAIRPSFWFGGAMWHARVAVSSTTVAGDYPVQIHAREVPVDKVQALHFVVHADAASYQQSFKSVIRRVLGLSPWWLTLAWALCAVGTFFGVYGLSQRVDQLLAQQGRAAVYLVRPGDEGQEIIFGLGSRHGLTVGNKLDVLDQAGRWIGFAEVRKVSEDDGLAWVNADCPVGPGAMVVVKR